MLLQTLIECLNEELHSELKDILDSDVTAHKKNNLITKKIRSLISDGKDTGLENDKPKKGTSRAVYFPKKESEIYIDGEKTTIPTAVKIAFPSTLDKYRPNKPLLGEMQNYVENEPTLNRYYSVLHKIPSLENHFEHNSDGILAPVISAHNDGHWLEMGKVHDFNHDTFKKLTTTDEFPKGITHRTMRHALIHDYTLSIGRKSMYNGLDNKIYEHPLVDKLKSYMYDSGVSPHDFDERNMGIWEHPITKTKHVVLLDFGGTTDILSEYSKARLKSLK